ncbi:MAG: hypothetical protein ACR2OU_06555 [Thermomicrobiales bacterium]
MSLRLIPMDDSALERYRDEIALVYASAFKVDAGSAWRFMTDGLDRHRRYACFRGLLAEDANGMVVGFTYGYQSQAGQWWHDLVRSSLEAAHHADWLDDAFEFVELAVAPDVQGQHIGGRLHDALLLDVPGRTALLSTLPGDTPATRLYLARGWIVLVHDFRYFPAGEEVFLMGLELETFRSASPDTTRRD